MVLWEVPWVGGRARGRQRPRAPSLNERPGGQRRAFGLRGVETDSSNNEKGDQSDSSGSVSEEYRDDSLKENGSPVVRGINTQTAGDGELKQRIPGQI